MNEKKKKQNKIIIYLLLDGTPGKLYSLPLSFYIDCISLL